MKKLSLFILIVFLIVVSGCGTNVSDDKELESDAKNHEKKEDNSDEPDHVARDSEVQEREEVELEQTPKFEYHINENIWSIEPIDEKANEEVVLLTIDDAPDGHALDMAETLDNLDAGAIFFVNGHFLETDEEKRILKEIHELGFLIGNHTYSHQSLPDLSEEEQKEEIVKVSDMVEEIIGERPLFFRAPFGQNTDYSKQIAKEEGMTLMNWTYGYDWNKDYMTQEAITDIMINAEELSNGANLLMHDREWTAKGLHDIVTGIRDKGYEPVDPSLIQTDMNE